jgi:heavy metal sensor kinase
MKLAWRAALMMSAGALLCFLAAVLHMHHEQLAEAQRELAPEAAAIFRAMRQQPSARELPRLLETIFIDDSETRLVEVIDLNGKTIYRSPHLGAKKLLPQPIGNDRYFSTTFDGHPIRVGVFSNNGWTMALGSHLQAIDESVYHLLPEYLLVFPILLLIFAYGGWRLARRALKPIDELADAVERMTVQRLDERLPELPSDDEVGRLTCALNATFERVEAGFREVERFTSDASHELKTPLTIIRGEVEMLLRRGGCTPEQEDTLNGVLDETRRLGRIVDGLLLLSRADGAGVPLDWQTVNFTELIEGAAEDAEILAEDRGIRTVASIQRGVWIGGDPIRLRQVLLNLLDNAVKYNKPGGRIGIELLAADGNVRMRIRNTGPGIPPDHAPHVFDRFYRVDTARNRGTDGHGLGLSLCLEIARAHGGDIVLSRCDAEWTEFCVTLPTLLSEEETGELSDDLLEESEVSAFAFRRSVATDPSM